MNAGRVAARMASGEIVSRIRLREPNDGDVSNPDSDLARIASDIVLFDESCLQSLSDFFAVAMHSILLSFAALVVSFVVATLENRTWLSENRDLVAVVFGLLLGLGALASKVMTVMANTSVS